MGLTTERKVFIGIASIAVVALIIDQGILSPGSAAAQNSEAPTGDVLNERSLTQPELMQIIDDSPSATEQIINRIESMVSETSGENSMSSLFSMTRLGQAETPITEVQSDDVESDQSESFPILVSMPSDLPSLSSVMPAKNGGGAVLSGTLLRIGERGDGGYRLIDVFKRSVLLEKDNQQYIVELPLTLQSE